MPPAAPRTQRFSDIIGQIGSPLLALLTVAAFGTIVLVALHGIVHIERLWDKETRLGIFEDRIAGVGDEMLRRSKKVRAVFDEFAQCAPNCPPSLFEKRDLVVKGEWPKVFPRLLIEKDWGTLLWSEASHQSVRDIVRKYGKDGAVLYCFPKLGFYHDRSGRHPYAYFDGFNCAASGKTGG